jgi:solute carrier family 25 oxoglutarate transporter 11
LEVAISNTACCAWLQFAVGSKIIAEEGVGALYRGLSAGLLRQATYTTARLGIYQYISDVLAKRHDGKVHPC